LTNSESSSMLSGSRPESRVTPVRRGADFIGAASAG
jgi:hypothetical protein